MAIKVFDDSESTNQEPEENQSNLPEPLQGKSPEEMYEILRQEHENVVNKIKASKFDEGQNQPAPKPAPARQAPQPTPPTSGGGVGPGYQEEVDIYSNPEKFMDQQFAKRLSPLIQTQTQALRGANRQMFQSKVGEDEWNRFSEEIEQFVDALHPQLQVDQRAYQQAYNYVRSLHLDEIVEEKTTSKATEKLMLTLSEMGLEPDQIATVIRKAGGVAPEPEKKASGSLFQPATGVPRTASSIGSSKSDFPVNKPRGKYTPEERKLMEEFEMSPKEWDEYKAQNTDIVSSLTGRSE